MKDVGNDRVRLSVTEARNLGEAAMRAAGFNAEEAQILTSHVLDAALCGYEYSGLPKLLNVVDVPDYRMPRRPMSVLREATTSVLLDGGNNNGMIAAFRASEITIERASAHGMAIVLLANTWMTGRSAFYCEMIARAGLVAMHTVASPPKVAPFGGARAMLGTNPICFGFPTEGDPLIIDMGTSAFMGTDLKFRSRMGRPIPPGVALGPDGKPTTNADEAQKGTLLPFGGPENGYKGFGLALAMDAFGMLTAAARRPENFGGHSFIAFKPDLFLSLDEYRRALSERIAEIKATPRQPGVNEIRIPGERSSATRKRLMDEGIEIDRKIYQALVRVSEGNLDHGAVYPGGR